MCCVLWVQIKRAKSEVKRGWGVGAGWWGQGWGEAAVGRGGGGGGVNSGRTKYPGQTAEYYFFAQ